VEVTSSTNAASGAGATDRQYSFSNSQLLPDDFMRLMIEELVNQDPLDPVKNESLLAQVSQIKNMETLSNLDKSIGQMTLQQKVLSAGGLIGRQVSGVSTDNANVTGIVVKANISSKNGVTLVTSAGDEINLDDVTAIQEVSGK